jgi:hypothetical protein
LTASIIGHHQDVFMPGENHYFEMIATGDPLRQLDDRERQSALDRLMRLYEVYNQPADQERVDRLFTDGERLNELGDSADSYASLFAAFMEVQCADARKARWGNQAPKDIFHLAKIKAAFPRARFIACTRDPRDFLLSYKRRWRVSAHGGRLHALYHPILTSLLWRSTMRAIEEQPAEVRDATMVLRYEDLVHSPNVALQRMCDHLRIEFDPLMLRDLSNNSSHDRNDGGIFTSSIGRWREELSAEEVELAQWINRDLMAHFDYERESIGTNPVSLLGWCSTLPYAAVRALYANRNNRGPLLAYLRRRLLGLAGMG